MQVQINTDGNIDGREQMAEHVESQVRGALDRFSERITRVEVHLRDDNSDKKVGPGDKRCLLEARLADRQPIVVSEGAATMELAVDRAAGKLKRSIESILGRLESR